VAVVMVTEVERTSREVTCVFVMTVFCEFDLKDFFISTTIDHPRPFTSAHFHLCSFSSTGLNNDNEVDIDYDIFCVGGGDSKQAL